MQTLFNDEATTPTAGLKPVAQAKPSTKVVRQMTPSAPRAETTGSVGSIGAANTYRLDSGDRVRVVVAGHDVLSASYDIDSDGAIYIPSLGAVTARGLNAVQLSAAIARRLKITTATEPHVAVQVETYRPFTIRGDVANPGQYPYVNNMTTETAIAIAGGLKSSRAEKKRVTINSGEPESVTPVTTQSESPVRPGDTLTVTEER